MRPESGEGMATGNVVNTASRLQGAAPVDGVLVDERTHRATDRSIRYAEAEPIGVKGKSRPVAVWRALETRSLLPEQSAARKLDKAVVAVMANERDRGWATRHLRPLVGLGATSSVVGR